MEDLKKYATVGISATGCLSRLILNNAKGEAMQDQINTIVNTIVANEVPIIEGDYLQPIDEVVTQPRVPGSYRQRLENKLNDMGALAGRRGGRKSAGIPVAWVTDPKTGDAVRILVGKPPSIREKDKSPFGLIKYESAMAKRNRKKRKRISDALLSGAPILGYRDGFQR